MRVVRPTLSDDLRDEITRYLSVHWKRALDGRQQQVDSDYARWDKAYRAIPREKTRSMPWLNASNIVVPLIRIHLDTFLARTLGSIFSTQPILKVHGFPQEIADPLEKYLNYKCLHQWETYDFASAWMFSGNKNGTSAAKTAWIDQKTIDIMPSDDPDAGHTEEEVDVYVGPRPEVIPFEDYYVYPITATRPHQVKIRFHRIRYVAEDVKELVDSGRWGTMLDVPLGKTAWDVLEACMKPSNDVKREQTGTEAGVVDPLLDELEVLECHFRYEMTGKYYDLVALLVPSLGTGALLDLYFNPHPRNIETFRTYVPFPRESLAYGESMAQVLERMQEEASAIHNDRRNNSYIANTPMFKKKTGSLVPNQTSAWFPGCTWEVDNMDDLEPFGVGRNYDSMLDQEGHVMSLANLLMGSNQVQQGSPSGVAGGQRGIYSAQGTMAVLSESADRQGKNTRDFREALSSVLKASFILQKTFQPDDPALQYFPPADQKAIGEALSYATPTRTHLCPFEIRTSTARMNQEMDRQNLMQMMGVVSQYYQQVMGMSQQLLDPKLNPGLRLIISDIINGHKSITRRLLRAFDEIDPDGVLPDLQTAVNQSVPGGADGTKQLGANAGAAGQQPSYGGGMQPNGAPLSRSSMGALLQIPTPDAGMGGGPPA